MFRATQGMLFGLGVLGFAGGAIVMANDGQPLAALLLGSVAGVLFVITVSQR